MIRVKHLAFYPVKSAAGIEIPYATLTPSGLAFNKIKDHMYMVVSAEKGFVEANGQYKGVHEDGYFYFVTQRDRRNKREKGQTLSIMQLIKPQSPNIGSLQLTWKYKEPIDVPNNLDGATLPVNVWDNKCIAVDQGDEIAGWLSDHLSFNARLVMAGGPFRRIARQNYTKNENPMQFQDGYPVHWFPIESVNELSEKAGIDIPWQSFRPQIVVEGMSAQSEHKIYSGSIGVIPFTDPKPCDRCTITLVDPETGFVRGKEPLRTLRTYKNWTDMNDENKVIFGENMLPEGEGSIALGSQLILGATRTPPLVYGA